jgi:hypothetical protein
MKTINENSDYLSIQLNCGIFDAISESEYERIMHSAPLKEYREDDNEYDAEEEFDEFDTLRSDIRSNPQKYISLYQSVGVDDIIFAKACHEDNYYQFNQAYDLILDICIWHPERNDFVGRYSRFGIGDDDDMDKPNSKISYCTNSCDSSIMLDSLLEIGQTYRQLPKKFQNDGTILLLSLTAYNDNFK